MWLAVECLLTLFSQSTVRRGQFHLWLHLSISNTSEQSWTLVLTSCGLVRERKYCVCFCQLYSVYTHMSKQMLGRKMLLVAVLVNVDW